MPHAAELTSHAVAPTQATPPLTKTSAPVDGGLWLFLLGFVSFGLALGATVYLSTISF